MPNEKIMRKLLKYIRDNDNCTIKQIQEALKFKKEKFHENIQFCEDHKYLTYNNISNPPILNITDKGLSFLKEHSWFDKKQIVYLVISFMFGLFTMYVSFHFQQTVSQKNEPLIELTPDLTWRYDLTEISAKKLMMPASQGGKGAPLKLIVSNKGRGETGKIELLVVSGRFRSQREIIENLPNNEGHTYEPKTLYLRDEACYIDDLCNIAIPKGMQTINIFVNCMNCNPKKSNYSIDVCIWHNTTDECVNLSEL